MADSSKDYEELKKLNQQLAKGADLSKIRKDAEAVKLLLEAWRKEADSTATSITDLSKQMRNVMNDLMKSGIEVKNINKAFRTTEDIVSDLRNDTEGITQLNKKDLQSMEQKLKKAAATMNFERQQLEYKIKIAKDYNVLTTAEKARLNEIRGLIDKTGKLRQNENNYLLRAVEMTKERLAEEKEVEKRMGIAGATMKGVSTILDKVGMGGLLQMDEIAEKMEEVARDGGGKMKVLGAGLKESFKTAGLAMRDLVGMTTLLFAGLTKLVHLSLQYEDKQFEVAKAMGVSVTEGQEMLNNFQSMAMANGQLAMTAKQLADTYGQMNDTLGFLGPQNAEFLTTTAGIQRRLGVSAESMQLLQYSALKAGKSLTKTYSDVVGTSKAIGASLKLNMSEKQVVEAISKVSTTVLNNFKGNVKQLTAAVMTATKFGTTLDTINSQGSSLLDFESSISKEFEAQLLTGKDLNLSKARELALNHDTDGLMKELNSKMMTSAEYGKMNVLQQQSFAEAVGLSKEQMDEMYHKQEMVKLLGDAAGKSLQTQYNTLVGQGKTYDQIAATLGDQAAQDAKRATAQEQMQATMERISDQIGKATHGIAEMVTKIAEFFSHTENIKATLAVVGGIMSGMVVYSLALSAQKKEQALTEMMIKKETLQQATLNNKILATQVLQNNQSLTAVARKELETIASGEKAAMETAGAAASVTAGSSYLGPGAIIVGMLAATALMGLLSSMGGPSKSVSAPSMPASAESISPTNFAAESAKAAGPQKLEDTGKTMSRGGNPNIYITLDTDSGKKTVKRLTDYSAGTDSSKIAAPISKS